MGVGNDYPGYGITHRCDEDIEIIDAISKSIFISTPKTLADAHEAGSTLADSKQPVYVRLARKESS